MSNNVTSAYEWFNKMEYKKCQAHSGNLQNLQSEIHIIDHLQFSLMHLRVIILYMYHATIMSNIIRNQNFQKMNYLSFECV